MACSTGTLVGPDSQCTEDAGRVSHLSRQPPAEPRAPPPGPWPPDDCCGSSPWAKAGCARNGTATHFAAMPQINKSVQLWQRRRRQRWKNPARTTHAVITHTRGAHPQTAKEALFVRNGITHSVVVMARSSVHIDCGPSRLKGNGQKGRGPENEGDGRSASCQGRNAPGHSSNQVDMHVPWR